MGNKILPIIFFLCVFYQKAYSQASPINRIAFSDSLNKGIYEEYEEFQKNRPYDKSEFHFYKAPPKAIAQGALPNFLVKVDKNGKRDTIDSEIWGFCTGSEVYKLRVGDSVVPSYYVKLLFIGRYIYYEDLIIFSVDAGGMLTGNPRIKKEKIIPYVININNGQEFRVDDSLMGTILKDDPEMLSRYKNERNRHRMYESYIREYSENHKDQIH